MTSYSNVKRKQDDKNVKSLRELAVILPNKHCFDCTQRGPTYVNMTIGSFCCTTCSGILRGLNPPHRVKSISMASFTVEDVEFIRNRGNEQCRKIWLGLYDGQTIPIGDGPRDDHQIKDHLIKKYERKRWYVSPSEIVQQQKLISQHSKDLEEQRRDSTDKSRSENEQQQTTLVVDKVPSTDSSLDLFSIDPFGSPAINGPVHRPNFANFANFDTHSSNVSSFEPSVPKSTTIPASLSSTNPAINADKYSALAELDDFFHTSQPSNGPSGAIGQTPSSQHDIFSGNISKTNSTLGAFPLAAVQRHQKAFLSNSQIQSNDQFSHRNPFSSANPFGTQSSMTANCSWQPPNPPATNPFACEQKPTNVDWNPFWK